MKRKAFQLFAMFLVHTAWFVPHVSRAQPITLPVDDIAVLTYSGYETRHAARANTAIGVGDVFDGIVQFGTIRNAAGTADLSGQLSSKELTAHFQFHVISASAPAHLEFAPDFFRLFVGSGTTKNFDAAAPDAVARATDGELLLEVLPGPFFESVNDPINGAPTNRAWLNVTNNLTGYDLGDAQFPSLLGKDSSHVFGGQRHGDHLVQMYFENFPGPSDLAQYSFGIRGDVYLHPIPEPSTFSLLAAALIGFGIHLRKEKHGQGA